MFFQEKCLFSIPIPFRTLCWLCFCATVVVCCRCVLHRLCSTTCKHPCLKLGVSLFRHPCRKPLSPGKGLYYWGYRPDQARMLAVSHTKPLHDAVAQMADDLYGGYAPATPFLNNQEVYRQSKRNSPTFFIFPIDKSPVSVYTVYITHKQFDYLLCDVSLLI